jgi:uncharacterized protein (DUF952 family)
MTEDNSSSPSLIYKILSREEWSQAQTTGTFVGSAIDLLDGFMHFCTAQQAQEVASLYFQGQSDLLLVAVDSNQFKNNELKWEVLNGAKFPHLYTTLDPNAVVWAKELLLRQDGTHEFPVVMRS